MKTTIKGQIILAPNTCNSILNELKLELVAKKINQRTRKIGEVDLKEDGSFEYNLEEELIAESLFVQIHLSGKEKKETLVKEFGPYCGQKDIQVSYVFDPKEHLVWFDYINKQIKSITGDGDYGKITEEQYSLLSCQACVPEIDLRELSQAYKWQKELINMAKSCITKAKGGIEKESENLQYHAQVISSLEWLVSYNHNYKVLFVFAENNIGMELSEVLTLTEDGIKAILNQAVENKRVTLTKTDISKLKEALSYVRDCYLFNANYDDKFYDAKLLHISSFDGLTKHSLLDQALAAGGIQAVLDKEEKDIVKGNKAKKIDLKTLELKNTPRKRAYKASFSKEELSSIVAYDRITVHFAPLLAVVIKELRNKEWSSNTILSYDLKKWQSKIEGIKSGVKVPRLYQPLDNAIEAYAQDIQDNLAKQHSSELAIITLGKTKVPGKTNLVKILKAAPDFDISKDAVSRYFKIAKKSNGKETISEDHFRKLQEFQRSIKLVGGLHRPEVIDALYQMDYTSSVKIIKKGRHQFDMEMAEMQVEAVLLDEIYCRARSRYDFLKEVATRYVQNESPQALRPAFVASYEDASSTIKQSQLRTSSSLVLPDLESLFGSMDSCNCNHCQSVYSPAAYLTDLLHWMSDDLICQNSNLSAYQVIDNRRPDIKYIQLHCKNTNTVLPYIDLVNELLLAYIDAPADNNLLQTFQTTKTSEELLLRPEHLDDPLFDSAKSALRDVHHHWSLPYDKDWDRSRQYLKGLGKPDYALAETLGIFKNEKWWVNARLGLVQYQLTSTSSLVYPDYGLLIENTPPANFWQNYYGSTDPVETVAELMSASDLSYSDVLALSKVAYIKGASNFKIEPENNCDLSEIELLEFGTDVALRLMKFVKLSMRSGFSFEELDLSLATLGISSIDAQALTSLAQLLDLRDQTQLHIHQVLSLLGDIPMYSSSLLPLNINNYYQDKFLPNKQSKLLFEESRLTLGQTISDINAAEKSILTSVFKFTADQLTSLLPTSGNWDIQMVSYLSKAELLYVLSGLSFENFVTLIKSRDNVLPPTITTVQGGLGSILSLQDVYDFQADSKKLSSFNEAFNDITNAIAWSNNWDIPLSSPIDFSDLMDSDLSANYNEFRTEWTALQGVTPPIDRNNILAKHQAYIQNLEEDLILQILNYNNSYLNPLNNELVFAETYRLIKRIDLMSNTFEIAFLPQYFQTTRLNVRIHFMWLEANYSSNSIDDVLELSWLKEYVKLTSDLSISHDGFLSLLDGFLGLITINSNQVNNRASLLFALINNQEFLDTYSESEFKLACKKAYSALRIKDYLKIATQANKVWTLSKELNVSVDQCWSLVFRNDNFNGAHQYYGISLSAGLLQNSVDARHNISEVMSIENMIRVSLRDRLLAYHLTNSSLEFENSNAVYAYYLLDPEMDACMKTSRIKLALSGSQLLVHRAVYGLEPDLCPSTDHVKQWEWRQNYRVWEANRKVFLYPENWIDPTLRIEKSEFYEELEDTLLQDEITTENCEKAVAQYLQKLNKVARLDIRAFHTEIEEEVDGSILHVFGRTFSTPYEYYYRKRTSNKKWTPWEKLELDIEGEHIIPTFFNGKLYLIWPMFIEKEHRKIKRVIEGEEQNAPYLEVKLCYSKLEFGKWSSKRLFDATLLAGHYGGKGCFNNIRYKLGQDVPQVLVGHEFSGGFPFGITPVYGPQEIDNGSLVLTNNLYQDYAKVSLDKNAFYFWPEIDKNNDLIIHVRRDFHKDWDNKHYAYVEMAYEDSFKISSCDESVELIEPIIIPQDVNGKRYLSRPYRTIPIANRMIEGLDNKQYWDDNDGGVYVKQQISHSGPNGPEILKSANSPYYLTYPVGDKHAMWHLPFFMTDKRHTLFFEREVETKCRKKWIIKPTENFPGYYRAQYYSSISDKYSVEEHEHPYVCTMLSEFNQNGFEGFYRSSNSLLDRQSGVERYFRNEYDPVNSWIKFDYPTKHFDFHYLGSYSLYNMEMFFHLPSLVVRQLKSNGKYADAIKWIQFIFDPTNRDMHLGNKRFWMIKPFVQNVSNSSIQNLIALLSTSNLSPAQERERQALEAQIEAWEENPFEPHRIAEMRVRAYMLWTVYEYVDILIEWGDSLFSQDTIESINQATNLYILASEILGRRPLKIDKEETTVNVTFDEIRNGLDAFSNTLENLENEIPNYNPVLCCKSDRPRVRDQSLPDLLFCIPDNPKVLEYWDRVEDRLFKIRHCMNIEGQVRDLALFQPPIDPGLLVRARAMGLSIGDVLADINAPDPIYRFSYLIQKANEFTNELKSLGGQLLSAFEKKDAEELSQIRQLHERNILKATRNIKKLQLEDAKNGLKSLEHSKKLIEIRLDEYSNRKYMNTKETVSMALNVASETLMDMEKQMMVFGKITGLIPDIQAGFAAAAVTGGKTATKVTEMVATSFGIAASKLRLGSSLAGTLGSYDRRKEDWDFQVETAKEELKQIDKQLLGAEIRIALAEKELDNHDLQMEQSAEIYDYLKSKFTNEKLYGWMATELSKLSRKAFELANGIAKQAQAAYKKELGIDPQLIENNNWDGSKKGLLAGEKLGLQLKSLEDAYLKEDTRRFELNKSISLRLLDPQALVNLIEHQYCEVFLESTLFDLDFRGKKLTDTMIKTLSVSIPSVTGPHVSTHLKLRYQKEEMITSSGVNDSGVFDGNPSQTKYVPFEYKKLESEKLEILLPEDSDFDISTISDVVLNFNYTAVSDTTSESSSSSNTPSNETHLLMSWRHDFPMDWQALIDHLSSNTNLPSIPDCNREHIPYRYRVGKNYSSPLNGNVFVFILMDDQENLELVSIGTPNLNTDNEIEINGKKVVDIWLLYDL